MQTLCEYCGERLSLQKAIKHRQRELIKAPRSHKVTVCHSCGRKNFIKF